jgi:hypothetical protein
VPEFSGQCKRVGWGVLATRWNASAFGLINATDLTQSRKVAETQRKAGNIGNLTLA